MTAPAIPEFILRKLIVPNSFSSGKDHISFSILNSFAPGTLFSLAIEVDGISISAEQIILSAKERSAVKASEITPANPYPLSMGLVVTIEIQNVPSAKEIRFSAITKELGQLSFSFRPLNKSQNKLTNLTFKRKLFSLPISAKVSLFPEETIGRISPNIYGQFIEHLEDCIYGGIWTKDGSELRTDTLKLIKRLHPSITRYPGGNFASGYHWEDGIGPKANRPERFDSAWQAPEKNLVGTDEYIQFCRAVDTEPFLVVNDGSGSPEEAARWVDYCNSDSKSEQGRRRKANGFPDPHNVRMWGIGNEVWGAWQIGTTDEQSYSDRLLKFAKSMRKADPGIKIVAVGDGILTDTPDNKGIRWNREVLEKAGDQIDYLSWHIYQPDQSAWLDSYDLEKLHWSVCAAPLDVEKIIQRVAKLIKLVGPSRKITQALDEWNLWLTPPPGATSMHKLQYTMRDALYCAGMLNVFIRGCRDMGMANLAQLVNILPLIVATDQGAFATPMYYPFLMYQKMLKVAIKNNVECPVFENQALGNNISAHHNVPMLDISATRDDHNRKLTVALTNRHHSSSMHVRMDMPNFEGYIAKRSVTLSAQNPLEINTIENPDAVIPRDSDLPIRKRNSIQGVLPPCSVTVWEFEKN